MDFASISNQDCTRWHIKTAQELFSEATQPGRNILLSINAILSKSFLQASSLLRDTENQYQSPA
jgi:hypothetical protein